MTTSRLSELIRTLAIAALVVSLTTGGMIAAGQPVTPIAALADDDDEDEDEDDEHDDKGGDDGDEAADNSGKGSDKGRGNDKDKGKDKEKEKDDPDVHDRGHGNDDKPDNRGRGGPVTRLPAFRVVVECAPFGDGRSACLFLGLGDAGVARLVVPEVELCATVDGASDSDAPDVERLSTATGAPALVANDDALLLVLAAAVETSGSTTYWVWADDGQLYPATGPALICDEPAPVADAAAPPPTTGAIVIRAFACGAGVAAGADVDWYAVCAEPASAADFTIQPAGAVTSGAAESGVTDSEGRLVVPDLPPGTYHVEQSNGNWCHAESDSVDDQGDIIVGAGVESTVWVFDCEDQTGL